MISWAAVRWLNLHYEDRIDSIVAHLFAQADEDKVEGRGEGVAGGWWQVVADEVG